MPLLKWSESYSVGVAALDADHKHFFDLLNRVYAGILDGSANDAKTRPILEQVKAFAIEHCNREEEMLAAADYPLLDEIRPHHRYLREKIEEFEHELDQHGAISLALANFLMEWVIGHVLKEDRECGAFLNRAGVY